MAPETGNWVLISKKANHKTVVDGYFTFLEALKLLTANSCSQ